MVDEEKVYVVSLIGPAPGDKLLEALSRDLAEALGEDREESEKRITQIFSDDFREIIAKWVQLAKSHNASYVPPNFESYFEVRGHSIVAKHLSRMKYVGAVDEGRLVEPPERFSKSCKGVGQDYLDDAPQGVGARAAWQNGYVGQGVSFVDVEIGWILSSPDFKGAPIHIVPGGVNEPKGHGTKVLGIIAANNDGAGVTGIAYGVKSVGLSPIKDAKSNRRSISRAIARGGMTLNPGDVLLVEAHWANTHGQWPIEYRPDVRAEIELLTQAGICVIEPAGNGGSKLGAGGKDSGAIIVGAVDAIGPSSQYEVRQSSNFGARVDAYALGECIQTSGPKGGSYFRDTSGAAAIVAGVVVVMQSAAKAAGRVLAPHQIRNLLRSHGTGVSRKGKPEQGRVPDLKEIIKNV